MRGLKFILLISVILSSFGCSAARKFTKAEQDTVMDIYLQALSSGRRDAVEFIRNNLKVNKAFGYVKPYVPVVEPAAVRLIWLPAHKSKYDSNTLVSGHWVYVMLNPNRWFIDSQANDKGTISVIVPHKEGVKK